MKGQASTEAPAIGGAPLFTTTHWSVVLAAAKPEAPESIAALERLCYAYWYPLYVYVRRRGYGHEDAQDFTQGFLLQLLERHSLERADKARGRFRSFLLGGMNYFLADEMARQTAKKRGGGKTPVFLDAGSAEERYRLEPVDTMDAQKLFERRWATALLNRVLERLEAEFAAAGKKELFEQLRQFLLGERSASPYAQVAARTGMSEGAVKVAVHRMRRRYRDLFHDEVAQTVDEPAGVEDEMRCIFAALAT